MTLYITLIIGAFLLSAICGFIAIPEILNYCKDKNLYDIPDSRKVHKNLVPRLGGISFMPSMLLSFIIALFVFNSQFGKGTIQISLWSIYFLIGLLLIYSVGIVDDLIGLSANIKFVVQIISASLLPLAGLYINNMYGLFGIHEISYWVGVPLTIFIIVFICNSMNLIDGIDGLCAGLSEIALGGFLLTFMEEGLAVYCILIAGLMGVLVPYLYFNLFGKSKNNRKIFMGDSGSLTLGFILSFLFVKLSMDNRLVMAFEPTRMNIAVSLLLIPTFDVARIIIYRLRYHRPIFDADKNHIHHRLMNIGLTMHQALITILGLALAFIAINMLLFPIIGFTYVFLTDIALYTGLHLIIGAVYQHKLKEECAI